MKIPRFVRSPLWGDGDTQDLELKHNMLSFYLNWFDFNICSSTYLCQRCLFQRRDRLRNSGCSAQETGSLDVPKFCATLHAKASETGDRDRFSQFRIVRTCCIFC